MAPNWKNSNMLEAVAENEECVWRIVPLTTCAADVGAYRRIHTSWNSNHNITASWWRLSSQLLRRNQRRMIPASYSRFRVVRKIRRQQLVLLVVVLAVLLVGASMMNGFRVRRRSSVSKIGHSTMRHEPDNTKLTLSSIVASWIVDYATKLNTLPFELPPAIEQESRTLHDSLRRRLGTR